MITNNCNHEWQKCLNDYISYGGGQLQPMFRCQKCKMTLPASEVLQLESLENQNQTLRHLKGFQSYIAIIALIVSFIAVVISLFKK